MKKLNDIIFDATAKAAFDALRDELGGMLAEKDCKSITISGAIDHNSFGSGLGFSKVELKFVYREHVMTLKFSPNGGQFEAIGLYGVLKTGTCQSIDTMIKKLDIAINRLKA